MEARIAGLTHVNTIAFGRFHLAVFELRRGDRARAAPHALELARITREHDLPLFHAFGVFLEGLATIDSGKLGAGLEGVRLGAKLLRECSALVYDGLLKIAQAESERASGDPERAISIIDEALATCDRADYHAFEAELHRVRGEILWELNCANPAPAEEAFQAALAVGKQQGARSFKLRAALALAKLHQSTGRPADAHAVLAPALEVFAPTPEMPEIAEAQALLECLARGGEGRGLSEADPLTADEAPPGAEQNSLFGGLVRRGALRSRPGEIPVHGALQPVARRRARFFVTQGDRSVR